MNEIEYEKITKKQKEFFEKLKSEFASKPFASFDKIKELFGYKSKNSIKQYFDVFLEKGLILNSDNKYYINPKYLGARFAASRVKAGFAAIMEDKIDSRISFDNLFNLHSPSVFVFRVSGDSMSGIGILDEDYVVVRKTQTAKVNDVVLAIIDNEFTLKTLKKDSKGYYLQPENNEYPIIRPENTLAIFGVAVGITREIR